MGILESMKEAAEHVTGIPRPSKQELADLVRKRKPHEFRFKDDGLVPNHPTWSAIVYLSAVKLSEEFDPAAAMAYTTTLTTTRGYTRSSVSLAEPARSNLEATGGERFP